MVLSSYNCVFSSTVYLLHIKICFNVFKTLEPRTLFVSININNCVIMLITNLSCQGVLSSEVSFINLSYFNDHMSGRCLIFERVCANVVTENLLEYITM